MSTNWLTGDTIDVLAKALDGLHQRHLAIASNLANVDTPGYHRQDVVFEKALQQALMTQSLGANIFPEGELSLRTDPKAAHPQHLAALSSQPARSIEDVRPQWLQDETHAYRNDGNAVDVETEMARLADNTNRYTALARIEAQKFKSLRNLITAPIG
jgi:flagellar basal-body rod protein FlgB